MVVAVALEARRHQDGPPDGPTVVFVSVGALGYLLGGPLVHASRSNGNRMALSLAMRVLLPATGAAVANDDEGVAMAVGVAMLLDWLVLSRDPARPPVLPYVQPAAHGGGGWLDFPERSDPVSGSRRSA